MKILLLGSSGVIGTAIEKVCASRKIECVGLTHDDFEITDREGMARLLELHKPDIVINCVVFMGINPCEEKPDVAFAVNATAVLHLAKMCDERGLTLVQPSSHAVFNGKMDYYYTEDDPPVVTSVYSGSKYLSEAYAENLCRRHYVVRFPTIFGKRRNNTPGFVDKVIQRIERGEPLRIADDKIDSPTFSLDAAEVVISLLTENKPYGLYHIANTGKVSYYDFVCRIADIMHAKVEITRAKDAAIGCRKDDGRLVQKWAWFILRSVNPFLKLALLKAGAFHFNFSRTSLINRDGRFSCLGKAYAEYVSRL